MIDFSCDKPIKDFTGTPVKGIIMVNDPHLDLAGPGSRVDDYGNTVRQKMDRIFGNACEKQMLLTINGDVFFKSRVSPAIVNYLISKCYELQDRTGLPPLVIAGNHDMKGSMLSAADSLWSLKVSRAALVLSETDVFGSFAIETKNGALRNVVIGGTPYGQLIPKKVSLPVSCDSCLWLTHHNLDFSTQKSMEAVVSSMEIDGVDEVFNGHIHHAAPSIRRGKSLYHNIGSVTRTKLDERERLPVIGIWVPSYEDRQGYLNVVELKSPEIESAFSQRSGRNGATQADLAKKDEQRKAFVIFLSGPNSDEQSIEEQIDIIERKNELSGGAIRQLRNLSAISKQSALKG